MSHSPNSDHPSNKVTDRAKRWDWRRISVFVGLLGCLLFALGFVHPFGNARLANSGKQLMATAQIDRPAFELMRRSCQNCHSERTAWPIYSRAAPISWLIEKDVQDGRKQWNMSRWDEYTLDQREDILSRIGPMVRNRKMPLPQYSLLHPEAKLTDTDKELLYRWSRQERKRLRAEEQASDSPPR